MCKIALIICSKHLIHKAHQNQFSNHIAQSNSTKTCIFLESGDKIRYFWEEHAFDSDANLLRDPKTSINKIGHALHTIDPIIHSYVYGYLPTLAFDLGLKLPMPLQSMYICKPRHWRGSWSSSRFHIPFDGTNHVMSRTLALH